MSIAMPVTSKDYDAQWDAETLTKAAEIKADAERHGRAKSFAAAKVRALRTVAGEEGDKELPTSAETSLQKGYRAVK